MHTTSCGSVVASRQTVYFPLEKVSMSSSLLTFTATPTPPVHCVCAWVCIYVCAHQNQGSFRDWRNTEARRASGPRTHLQFYRGEDTFPSEVSFPENAV